MSDTTLFLSLLVFGALIGLGIGVAILRFRPHNRDRYPTWLLAVPWWYYLAGISFFLLMAWHASRYRWGLAAVFVGGAILNVLALVQRALGWHAPRSVTNSHASTTSTERSAT